MKKQKIVLVLSCLLLTINASMLANIQKGSAGYSASVIGELGAASTVLIYSQISATVKVYLWNEYWEPTTYYLLVPIGVSAIGSGFFVSADGYVATAGHVLFCFTHTDFTQDLYTKYALIDSAFDVLVDALEEALGRSLTSTELTELLSYMRTYSQLQDSIRTVYVVLGEVKPTLTDVKAKGWVARVVDVSPYIERDLALLKIEGLTYCPILKVGDSNGVMTGDNVYMFGFPGVVTFHLELGPETVLAPTMTSGIISGKRYTSSQTPCFQTDAAITHGMSGGPGINVNGEVIGVCSRGSISETGQMVAGFDFLIQSNVLKSFLTEANVQNVLGPVDEVFLRGLNYFYGRHFSAAKHEFETAYGLFPYHWRAEELIKECNAAIARGEDIPLTSTAAAIQSWTLIAIAVVTVVVASVVILLVMRKRVKPH